MPTSSQFYGIVVRMYYGEDGAPPHFHAIYGDREITLRIPDLEILDGALPERALALVREWAERHQAELAENWRRTLERAPLQPIEPLD
jgi:hypothetical protein